MNLKLNDQESYKLPLIVNGTPFSSSITPVFWKTVCPVSPIGPWIPCIPCAPEEPRPPKLTLTVE